MHSLVSARAMNNREGVAEAYDRERRRYVVRVAGKRIRVQRKNLSIIDKPVPIWEQVDDNQNKVAAARLSGDLFGSLGAALLQYLKGAYQQKSKRNAKTFTERYNDVRGFEIHLRLHLHHLASWHLLSHARTASSS
uniref:Uncharacterized protein n=1 Tax=Lotharella oceanica TaxID=641309 RepID=A0A7S2X6C0_9EUKA|mmetsp:Transcript_12057/g.23225  ORF Transcript_12057/g.23225 Transcript_12057/m.23225 type:complete len:136 (+) Transcript_12057:421-828(+)